MSQGENQKSLLQKLWDRRFFQYLATYLGVSWGLIQFSEWVVNRYGVHSSFIDHLALFLFALVPAVASFIYFHGRAGDDEWKPFEKIAYPINLVLALGASFVLVDGSAQATTRDIQITNVEGDTLIRTVPSEEYTNRIVLFPFESTLEEKEDWMRIAIPTLIDADIEQDMRWFGIRATSLMDDYQDYGYDWPEAVPFATKRKIAQDNYCDFIATGDLKKEGNNFTATLRLTRTKDGKEIYNESLTSEDIYGLADQMSSAIRDKINNKRLDDKLSFVDLPSSDLISPELGALENYIKGTMNMPQGPNFYQDALQYALKSTQLDPNCATCFSLIAEAQSSLGQDNRDAAFKAVETAEQLPERQQLRIKFYNYAAQNDIGKMEKLLSMWKDLYPQEVFPFNRLIYLKSISLNYNAALDYVDEAIEAGHNHSILLTGADVALKSDKLEKAETYINKYEKLYPEKAKKKSLLGDIYVAKGELDKAIEIYEEGTILNPANIEISNKLASVYVQSLLFEKAFSQYENALRVGKNHSDSISIYSSMMSNFIAYGMKNRVQETSSKLKEIVYNNLPKMAYFSYGIMEGSLYGQMINQDKAIDDKLAELIEIVPDASRNVLNPLIDYLKAIWKSDWESFPAAWETAKPLVQSTTGKSGLLTGELMLSYADGNYEECISLFDEIEEASGSNLFSIGTMYAECYEKAGKAEEGLEKIKSFDEKYPNLLAILFSKFRLLVAVNDIEEAKKLIPTIDKATKYTTPEWRDLINHLEIRDKITS